MLLIIFHKQSFTLFSMAHLFSSTEIMISLLFPFLVLLPLIFFILKHLKLSLSSKSTPPLPPGPFLWTFLGNKPHITLAKLAQTYGPLMTLKIGTQKMIVGSSKTAAMNILKTHDRVLSGRYVSHALPAKKKEINLLSMGFVEECNKEWKSTRETCQSELFARSSIESQASVREQKAMKMVRFVGEMEGEVLKFRDIVFATILSMISNILMSKDIVRFEQECVHGEFNGMVREYAELATAGNISDYFPILGGLDLQGLHKISMEVHGRMCSVWVDNIKERRRSMEKKSTQPDFLDGVIDAGWSDDQIKTMCMELISAGTDTSSLIEWTMAELIKNLEIMKKLQQELETHIQKDEEIKESKLDQLTYLQACIKETMRLHPTGPLLLPHRAIHTCHVMNYTIPKGSQVVVNLWAISRDPEYWEDPLVFKPERFLNSNIDFKGNHFEYFPFSSGRRFCPGFSMAIKQVPLILACLVRFFDWSLPEGNDPDNLDMSEKYALTVMKERPLLLIPKPSKHSLQFMLLCEVQRPSRYQLFCV